MHGSRFSRKNSGEPSQAKHFSKAAPPSSDEDHEREKCACGILPWVVMDFVFDGGALCSLKSADALRERSLVLLRKEEGAQSP